MTWTGDALAIREVVQITLLGMGRHVASGLVLAIIKNNALVAKCESWTVSGNNAVGELDLNTEDIVAHFAGSAPAAIKNFSVSLIVIDPQTSLATDAISIHNTPYDDSMSAPTPLVPWGTDLTTIEADIDQAQADIDAAESDIDDLETGLADQQVRMANHTHADGTGGGTLDHEDLSNIGTNSHVQIDTALTEKVVKSDLSYTIPAGTELRTYAATMTITQLYALVRTLLADLHTKEVI
jgi:hypothetical protein